MSKSELQNLNKSEELVFQLIQDNKTEEVIDLIKSGNVRINCLDKSGMNFLDQACFKGNEHLAEFLIKSGINVDNRLHEQGYTSLMFAALAGKPNLCQTLLDAGVRSYATNSIDKTASELAAFVGQHECVSIISSYIAIDEIDKLLHPKNPENNEVFPEELAHFIHELTRTHEIHPIRIIFNVMDKEVLLKHRKKILYVIDRLFERQLRSKEPNEVLSIKLWIILFTLRELLKFVQSKLTELVQSTDFNAVINEESLTAASNEISLFAKNLLHVEDLTKFHGVRPVEEQFLRTAVFSFPYKQSMIFSGIVRALKKIKTNEMPSAFNVICQILFGPRFVETAHFCLTCGCSSSQKRCKLCKFYYCSVKCQKFDWKNHKKLCKNLSNL